MIVLLWSFVFLWYCLPFPLFHVLSYLFGSSLFFLMRLTKSYQLCVSVPKKKNKQLWLSFLFSIAFLKLCLNFSLWSLLFPSFWLWASFVLFLKFRWQLKLFTWNFPSYLRKGCIATNLPLVFLLLHPYILESYVPFSFILFSDFLFDFITDPFFFFFAACCLVSTDLFSFCFSISSWFLVSYYCGQKKYLI